MLRQICGVVLLLLIGHYVVALNFDEDAARSALFHAYAAYCPEDALDPWRCAYCAANPDFKVWGFAANPNENTFAYIGVDSAKKRIVITFRGTQATSFKNWLNNINAAPFAPIQGVPDAECHSGFLNDYFSLRDKLFSTLTDIYKSYSSYPIMVTGHSLGGAMATLCTVDLNINGVNASAIFTFGSPRVGNTAFASYYNNIFGDVTTRMVWQRDIVPHLPLTLMGYHHVATEVWYYNGEYTTCDSSGEDPTCSDSLRIAISVTDHLDYMGVWESSDGCQVVNATEFPADPMLLNDQPDRPNPVPRTLGGNRHAIDDDFDPVLLDAWLREQKPLLLQALRRDYDAIHQNDDTGYTGAVGHSASDSVTDTATDAALSSSAFNAAITGREESTVGSWDGPKSMTASLGGWDTSQSIADDVAAAERGHVSSSSSSLATSSSSHTSTSTSGSSSAASHTSASSSAASGSSQTSGSETSSSSQMSGSSSQTSSSGRHNSAASGQTSYNIVF